MNFIRLTIIDLNKTNLTTETYKIINQKVDR
jgi:hypothetical protein